MDDGFRSFSDQHYQLLVLFVVGAVAVVALGRSAWGGRRTSRVLAVLLAVAALTGQAYQLTPGDFEVGSSLPVNLCDVAWVAAVVGLWTHRRLPVALAYYWGLTLTLQGILTPSLGQTFPDPRFVAFWALHLLVVWSALYLTLGLGIGPRWREYGATVLLTVIWAVLASAVNAALDVNYGYLSRKPGGTSLLDLLGPWPVYVVASAGVLVAVWALMTWPWAAARRR